MNEVFNLQQTGASSNEEPLSLSHLVLPLFAGCVGIIWATTVLLFELKDKVMMRWRLTDAACRNKLNNIHLIIRNYKVNYSL